MHQLLVGNNNRQQQVQLEEIAEGQMQQDTLPGTPPPARHQEAEVLTKAQA
jgi:hypothetical protein